MANVSDTFTDTSGLALTSHTTDSGHSWSSHPSYSGTNVISDANRCRAGNTSPHCYYIDDWTPASADYDVTIDHHVVSTSDTTDRGIGPAGRIDSAANSMVYIRYEDAADSWLLCERIAGTENIRDTSASPSHITPGVTKSVKLELRGTTAKGYVDGVEILSATLTTVTAAGFAGIRGRQTSASDAAGHHYDNFATADVAAGQNFDLTPATETDTASAIVFSQASDFDLTPATETDTAQALTFSQTSDYTITAATETDTAQALSFSQAGAQDFDLTPTAETDVAQALAASKHVTITPAAETSSPASILVITAIVAATETNTAQPLNVTKPIHKTLTVATTTETAQALTFTKTIHKTLTAAAETDSAQDLSFAQAGTYTLAATTTTDVAQVLAVTKTIYKTITPAAETDTAVTIGTSVRYDLTPAVETNTAQTLTHSRRLTFTPALETDQAQQLAVTHTIYRTITPAAETDVAVVLVGTLDELDPVAAGTITRAVTGSIARPTVGRI